MKMCSQNFAPQVVHNVTRALTASGDMGAKARMVDDGAIIDVISCSFEGQYCLF